MRKIFSLVLMMMCLLLGTVTAFANPYGGSHSFPAGMSPVQVLQYFHHKITDRDFGLAYDILTDILQKATPLPCSAGRKAFAS